MINLTIDNQKVKAREGVKILEAAIEYGIEIPHLCYHPELEPFGGCRLCLVEVEGEDHLVSSCVAPVAEGMEVHTSSPRIQRARKTIIQLLLLNHPMDCLVCERGGNCKLQKLAFDLNVQDNKYKMKKRVSKGIQYRSVLEIDPRKCVHCGLCVRVCKEKRHFGAIDFYNRGFKTEIGIPFSDETNCEFCGQCVEVCPVAGIIGLETKYIARPFELEETHTICSYCDTGCTVTLKTKHEQVILVGSEDTSGVNEGQICVKGRFGHGFINSSDRLTTPLIKEDGRFHPVSWDEALNYTADKLKKVIKTYGGQAVGGLGSVKCPNEDNYLFQKFMRAVVGTNNIDNYTRLEHSPTISALSKSLGLYSANNSLARLGSSELIFIIGSNLSHSHPIVALKIKAALKSGHSKLIVADPRRIQIAPLADLWLQLKPGADLALLGGIIHIILRNSLADERFIKENTRGFEAFHNSLGEYHSDRVAKITGVSQEELTRAAEMIAKANSLSVIYSSGFTQHVLGTHNVSALADLLVITGHAGREASGIYPLRDDSNSQGACDMGVLPDYLPGYQRVDDTQMREKFEKDWDVKLPSVSGLTSCEMFDVIREGKIKALYIMGDNPIRHYPHIKDIQKALSSLELLVVQDLFLSKTAELADVVLPATSFAEREGTMTNMERRVQKIVKAIDYVGESLPDWQIISRLSTMLGYPMDYSSVVDIMEEINRLVPMYGGISYQRLEEGGIQWPCPNEEHPGTEFLTPHWDTDKMAVFTPLPPIPVLEKEDPQYPFKLIIGGTLFHSGGGTLSMRSKILKDICPDGSVNLNPQDAAKLGIIDDDMVRISSRNYSVDARVRLIPTNPEGLAFMPVEFEELHAQEFMSDLVDPISHIPAMKVCSVSLAKVE